MLSHRYRDFLHTLCCHACIAYLIINILFQNSRSIIITEPTLMHHYHPQFILQYTLGVVQSMSLGKCMITTIVVPLLLLLSCFTRVRLCETSQTAAHQAPLTLQFSRQEYWSELPVSSPMHACSVALIMSDSVQPYGQQPTRLLCTWDSLGKNTGVGCQFLLHIVPHSTLKTCSHSSLQKQFSLSFVILSIHSLIFSPMSSPSFSFFAGIHFFNNHQISASILFLCLSLIGIFKLPYAKRTVDFL